LTIELERFTGKVEWFCATKGYGFIKQNDEAQKSIFVFWKDIQTGDSEGKKPSLVPDSIVEYSVVNNRDYI
jgi:cold shock CspA family protein